MKTQSLGYCDAYAIYAYIYLRIPRTSQWQLSSWHSPIYLRIMLELFNLKFMTSKYLNHSVSKCPCILFVYVHVVAVLSRSQKKKQSRVHCRGPGPIWPHNGEWWSDRGPWLPVTAVSISWPPPPALIMCSDWTVNSEHQSNWAPPTAQHWNKSPDIPASGNQSCSQADWSNYPNNQLETFHY